MTHSILRNSHTAIAQTCLVIVFQWEEQTTARLAQSAERKALNLVVVGSSPTVGVFYLVIGKHTHIVLLASIHVCDDRSAGQAIGMNVAIRLSAAHSIALLDFNLLEESHQNLVPLQFSPLSFCRLLYATQTLLIAFSKFSVALSQRTLTQAHGAAKGRLASWLEIT